VWAKARGAAHMNLKSALFKMALGFVIVCCALGALVFWMDDPLNLRAPKDQSLLTLFHDHRATFQKLRQMATEDLEQKNAVYYNQTASYGKLDEMRKQEYKHLLSEIHGHSVAPGYDGAVGFAFAGGGLSAISPGWSKGIVYLPGNYARGAHIVQNLDKANKLPAGVYLRQIESNWFIVYQRTDD
jgi:hypothetical protein